MLAVYLAHSHAHTPKSINFLPDSLKGSDFALYETARALGLRCALAATHSREEYDDDDDYVDQHYADMSFSTCGGTTTGYAACIGGFTVDAVSTELSLSVGDFAAKRVLDILAHTFGESTEARAAFPRPKKLSIKTPFPLEFLPDSRNFEHLTDLELSDEPQDRLQHIRKDRYLPRFLGNRKTVESLSLHILKETSNPRTPWMYLPPLYSDIRFHALLMYRVHLPALSTLHISNLALSNYLYLERFSQPPPLHPSLSEIHRPGIDEHRLVAFRTASRSKHVVGQAQLRN